MFLKPDARLDDRCLEFEKVLPYSLTGQMRGGMHAIYKYINMIWSDTSWSHLVFVFFFGFPHHTG